MLMQLKLAGKLEGVRGIVFGEMRDCVQTANQGYTLEEVVLRIVGELGVPVAYGVRSGHVTAGNITLPIGVRAGLTVRGGQVSLKILEAAVTARPGRARSATEIMDEKKHIHLIGICGTAMASLAGMLKQRGFRVTGSDAAAYPPMSDFLAELGIPVAQPFDRAESGTSS